MTSGHRGSFRLRAFVCALAWMGVTGCGADAPPERFVLITLDTLRADRVGAYAPGLETTPTLDGLAERGTRFETAIAPTPLTLPSHATLMTGLDPPQHGVHHNGIYELKPDIPTLASQFSEAGFPTAAFVSAAVLDRRYGLGRGFDVYDDQMQVARREAVVVADRRGDRTADAAIAWLETAPDRFFLWMHLYDPHALYTAPEPFRKRFAHGYDAEVAFADAQVARVLDALERRFPDGGNVVVVTSDHGESLGEHGERTHSYSIYDATQRVPLILSGAGIPEGETVTPQVRLADVAPTLLRLAGLPVPPGLRGRDLLPLARGEEDAPRPAYVESLATYYDMEWSPLWGVRTQTHKYVRAPKAELYNVVADPAELWDLAESDLETARTLGAELERLFEGGSDPTPNLDVDPAERAKLAALGYLPANDPAALSLGSTDGANPPDQLDTLETMFEANGLLVDDPRAALDLLEPFGDLHWAHSMRAVAAANLGDHELAREAAGRLIEIEPQNALGYAVMGRTYEQEGRPDAARETYETALQIDDQFGTVLTGMGRVAELEGDLDAAEDWYARARGARVPDSEAYWRSAAMRLDAGDVDQARALLVHVPAGDLGDLRAAYRLGTAELRAGRPDMALVRIEVGLRQHPDEIPLLRLRAEAFTAQRRHRRALSAREDALALAPDNPELQNDVAWSLALLGQQLPRARGLADQALASLPGDPHVLGTRALVALSEGDLGEAQARLADAFAAEAQGDRTLLLLHRAEARARSGELDGAEADWDAALQGRSRDELEGDAVRVARRTSAQLEQARARP